MPPQPRRPTQKRPRDRKAQIEREAADRFHAVGYHGVGIDEVAAAVGITGPALYRHFRGKQHLLASAVFGATDDVAQVVAKPFAAGAAPPQVLDELVGRLAALAVDNRGYGILWRRESRYLTPIDQAELRTRTRELAARISRILLQARPELGEDDAALLTWLAMLALSSPSYHRNALGRDRSVAVLSRIILTIVKIEATTCRCGDDAVPTTRRRTDPASEVINQARKERLLAVAVRLFDGRGFAAVGLEDIARECGITAQSVYSHFSSKGDLLFTMLMRGAERLQLLLRQALNDSPTPEEALTAVVESYVGFALQHSSLANILVTEVQHLPAAQRVVVHRAQQQYVAGWVTLIVAACPGLTQAEAQMCAHAVFAFVMEAPRIGRLRNTPGLECTLTRTAMTVLLDALVRPAALVAGITNAPVRAGAYPAKGLPRDG